MAVPPFPRRNTEVPSKVLALATLIRVTPMQIPLVPVVLLASMVPVPVSPVPMGSMVPMVPLESMVQVGRVWCRWEGSGAGGKGLVQVGRVWCRWEG